MLFDSQADEKMSQATGTDPNQSLNDATQFYQDRMNSVLTSSNIPPSEWELNQCHQLIQSETLSRFHSSNDNQFKEQIQAAFVQVKQTHKQLRHWVLIESVLGK